MLGTCQIKTDHMRLQTGVYTGVCLPMGLLVRFTLIHLLFQYFRAGLSARFHQEKSGKPMITRLVPKYPEQI